MIKLRGKQDENESENSQCPHCGNEITYLDYAQDRREYGTVSSNWGWESGDSEESGETQFFCPECQRELSDGEVRDIFGERQ